ncbi:hypothetical protein BDB00DRAFT_350490 [Zychaea mexicana]|uniref:uncharacterized protein n=1 Tax=Zychaea mexicana TaxID=64656 RepID=UPI0022FEF97E|nr:uncharacterized protein BDB00DRAFT_350490 [Zychaea mexicana]KAI9493906.1 hypothetical protein BDB00DRAFT_350490 [Zychaea mexicana]
MYDEIGDAYKFERVEKFMDEVEDDDEENSQTETVSSSPTDIRDIAVYMDRPIYLVSLLVDNCRTLRALKRLPSAYATQDYALSLHSYYATLPVFTAFVSHGTLFGSEIIDAITKLSRKKMLEIADCTANDHEMRELFQTLSSNEENIPRLERFKLSGNKGTSSWKHDVLL